MQGKNLLDYIKCNIAIIKLRDKHGLKQLKMNAAALCSIIETIFLTPLKGSEISLISNHVAKDQRQCKTLLINNYKLSYL